MSNLNLIIDFGSNRVTVGVFEVGPSDLPSSMPSPLFSASVACDGDLEAALSEVLRRVRDAGYGDFKRVALGVAAVEVCMRVIDTPITDKKKVEEILPLELSDLLIADTSELKFDSIRLSEEKVLGAAVEKDRLRHYIDLLVSSGVDPSWITVSLFSRDALLRGFLASCDGGDGSVSADECAAFIDTESLTVVKDDRAVFFKELTGSGDLALSIESLSDDGVRIDKFYATGEASYGLKGLGIEPVSMGDLRDDEAGIMAMAARMNEGLADAFNFRSGAFGGTLESNAVDKGAKLAVLFIALLVVSWGFHTYLRNKTFDIEKAAIESEITGTYKRLFRGEAAADPVYTLEAKLAELQRLSDGVFVGVDVLGVMRELSAINKASGGKAVKMVEFKASPATVILRGEAASKEAAEVFKTAVSGSRAFKDAVIEGVTSGAAGTVTFNIRASVEKAFFFGGVRR